MLSWESTHNNFASQVDPRLSWDYDESLKRARRIIKMYEDAGVPKEKVLIKVRIKRIWPLSPLSHVGLVMHHRCSNDGARHTWSPRALFERAKTHRRKRQFERIPPPLHHPFVYVLMLHFGRAPSYLR